MGDTPGRGVAGTKRRIGRRRTIRILIAGGGCAGTAAALHLQRALRERLRRGEAEITVVEPQAYFTYHPLLAEVAAGSIDPRHVVVPLRRVLPDCRVLTARITRIEHAARRALADAAGPGEPPAPVELPYDVLVVAPGSVSRTAPVPGLAEHGLGFSTVGEAVGLRNHVLEQLDLASATRDPALRQAALTFVFVGAGYAGVGALAELEDMARTAVRGYHNVRAEDLRWVLVEATGRILAEESPELARHTLGELRERGVDIRLSTTLESAADRVVALSDGSRFGARTLVWTAGVRPSPLLRATDLPLDTLGRVRCLATLQAVGPDGRALPGVWAAGDCAAVPDPNADGAPCAPNAQHAFAQAELLAR
ncbi:NAD(P)/FAD-dependent oxidoreductase, partial [Kitasatospora sp. MY 5-36]